MYTHCACVLVEWGQTHTHTHKRTQACTLKYIYTSIQWKWILLINPSRAPAGYNLNSVRREIYPGKVILQHGFLFIPRPCHSHPLWHPPPSPAIYAISYPRSPTRDLFVSNTRSSRPRHVVVVIVVVTVVVVYRLYTTKLSVTRFPEGKIGWILLSKFNYSFSLHRRRHSFISSILQYVN